MAHRNVEIIIGRLITDDAFRAAFLADPDQTLREFREAGHDLTSVEADAVLATPRRLWSAAASDVDPRLLKANLMQNGGRHGR